MTSRFFLVLPILAIAAACDGAYEPSATQPNIEAVRQPLAAFMPVWQNRSTTPSPSSRDQVSMVFDTNANRVLLFGGRTLGYPTYYLNDTWSYDGTSWTSLPAGGSPSVRSAYALAYDSTRRRAVLFGGTNNSTNYGDTYEFDGTNWALVSSTGPSRRYGAAMTYDSKRGVTVLTGGFDYPLGGQQTYFSETWEWNGAAWYLRTNTEPFGRMNHRMVFDAARGRSVLVGGTRTGYTLTGNVMEWDGSAWTPGPNLAGAAVLGMWFDTVRNRTVVLNGGSPLQLWEWDGSSWAQGAAGSGPPPTYALVAAFDPVRKRGIAQVSANSTSGALISETWEYRLRGFACASATSCYGGYCTDGVCCDASACGTCQTCDHATAPGICGAVVSAPDPDSCTGNSMCDAAGACKTKNGIACAGGGDCASGHCIDGVCCDKACAGPCDACAQGLGASADGVCTILTSATAQPSCEPYACSGTSDQCATSCADASGCASGFYCRTADGVCLPSADVGQACASSAECALGYCVDGVCCGSPCGGACEACTALKKGGGIDGVCGPVPAGSDPDDECAVEPASACGTDGSCDGAAACRRVAQGAACGADVCEGDTVVRHVCAGPGNCQAETTDCGAYACASAACLGACSGDAECAGSAYCVDGACAPKKANGETCTAENECSTGLCVDGVCCNAPCAGQCEACDTSSALGTCAPVLGSPHGDRPACATATAGDACQARSCDGTARTSCASYAGSDVLCRAKACVDDIATLPALCDGTGSCPKLETKPCEPYRCGTDECLTSCTGDAECAAGYRCEAGRCAAGGTCDGDHTVVFSDHVADCTPFTCNAELNVCNEACASTSDCATGHVCSGSQCIRAGGPSTAEDDGGCSLSPAPARGRPTFLLALALLLWRRRRREQGSARV